MVNRYSLLSLSVVKLTRERFDLTVHYLTLHDATSTFWINHKSQDGQGNRNLLIAWECCVAHKTTCVTLGIYHRTSITFWFYSDAAAREKAWCTRLATTFEITTAYSSLLQQRGNRLAKPLL